MTQDVTQVVTIVDPIAQRYGVPSQLWETVVQVESGFNPQAVGDNGTSYGLFQLHIGGQLPAYYNTHPQDAENPSTNAQLAMPALARAWSSLKNSAGAPDTSGGFGGSGSLSWWEQFAAQSGHPGYPVGGVANVAEAVKLKAAFSTLSNNPISTLTGGATDGSAASPSSISLSGVTSTGARVGVFIVAALAIGAGFYLIAKGRKQ